MDSITHIALGACVADAYFKKGFGKKAMLWGAMAHSLPDIDFIAGFWMGTAEELLAHRGFTHSILFVLLISPALALLAFQIHRPHNIAFRSWVYFFLIEIGLHLFLDGFNNYGVGWLEPFSHQRFSINAIYVADPFFSIMPIIAMIVLWRKSAFDPRRRRWWKLGLLVPAIYLLYCGLNKWKIDRETRQILAQQEIPYTRYFTTPAPLNNWLWYVVAGNDSGYHVGFRSVFDSKKEIKFEYFPRNDQLLQPVLNHEDLHRLIRFSQDFYTVEKWTDTLVFNDLRFGQITGWDSPRGHFVFHYYLQHPDSMSLDNDLVVQRGRFENWNWQTAGALFRRIWGN
jgi:inner membrane protein